MHIFDLAPDQATFFGVKSNYEGSYNLFDAKAKSTDDIRLCTKKHFSRTQTTGKVLNAKPKSCV